LIGEVLRLFGRKEDLLKIHSGIINEMNFKAILNNVVQLIASEIENHNYSEYYPRIIEEDIRRLFINLASSNCLSAQRKTKILEYLRKNQEYEKVWKNDEEANIANIRATIRHARSKATTFIQNFRDFLKGGFDHYYKFKNKEKINHTINFLKVNGITVSRNKVVDALNNRKCPYLTAWLRSEFALHYKYIRDNYNQLSVNDLRDVRYLYYLPNIDYLVSDDNLVAQIGQMVYKRNKVLTFDEFFSMF